MFSPPLRPSRQRARESKRYDLRPCSLVNDTEFTVTRRSPPADDLVHKLVEYNERPMTIGR